MGLVGSSPAGLTDEEARQLIFVVGRADENELLGMGFQPLTVGFANHVCAVDRQGLKLVVKQFTDLVFLRMDPAAVGAADVHAGEHGVGPRVLFSSRDGLVMERVEGSTLEEAQMHCGDHGLLESVATLLARLHELPVPDVLAGEPMLWRTVEKMMEVLRREVSQLPAGIPPVEEITREIDESRAALARRDARVVMAHGDFKPSNVMRRAADVTLIDFELAGPNYRGFDLMKVFRTAGGPSEACMRHFFKAYLSQVSGEGSDEAAVGSDEVAVEDLVAEARAFEPLTWLEAAVFFLTLPTFKPAGQARWDELAVDRWTKFQETKHLLLENGCT